MLSTSYAIPYSYYINYFLDYNGEKPINYKQSFDEHEDKYPATSHQSPALKLFNPPHRELPMFQVGTTRRYKEEHEIGARRTADSSQAKVRSSLQQISVLPPSITISANSESGQILPQADLQQGPQLQTSSQLLSSSPPQQGLLYPAFNPRQKLTTLPEQTGDQQATLLPLLTISQTPNLVTKPNEVEMGKKREMNQGNAFSKNPTYQISDREAEESNLRQNMGSSLERENLEYRSFMGSNSLGVIEQPEFISMISTIKRKLSNPSNIVPLNESVVLTKLHDNAAGIMEDVNKFINLNQTIGVGSQNTNNNKK